MYIFWRFYAADQAPIFQRMDNPIQRQPTVGFAHTYPLVIHLWIAALSTP